MNSRLRRFSLGIASTASLLVLGHLACGGHSEDRQNGKSPQSMADVAQQNTSTFLTVEGVRATGGIGGALPVWTQDPVNPSVMSFSRHGGSTCITQSPPTVDGNGFTQVVNTYNNCRGRHGGLVNGTVTFTFKANDYKVDYKLTTTKDSRKTWTFTGSRRITVDPVAKRSMIKVDKLQVTHTDLEEPQENSSSTLSADLTADWATPGQYKLWGTFSLDRVPGGMLSGKIEEANPLIWAGACCFPTAGTLHLTFNGSNVDVAFNSVCGQLTITPSGQPSVTVLLPACDDDNDD
jgi:hypothetical protein